MTEPKNPTHTRTNRSFRKTSLAAALSLMAGGMASPAIAGASFETDNGWMFGVNGHIPVFAISSDDDASDEDAFEITTGFNPATLQFNIGAPTQNGLDVSGHFQLNSHLAGADGVQNSGYGRQGFGRVSGVESRIAEIAIAGNFGTLNIGKGFGIFGAQASADAGSGMGVGLFTPNQGDATGGRIGHGYFYANFNPRVTYTTPAMHGLTAKVGLFNPEKPKDDSPVDSEVGTESPRIEANLVWSPGRVTLWSSAFSQSVDVNDPAADDFTMTGIDLGGAVTLGELNLRGNYATTQGTGNSVFGGHGVTGGAQQESADQWYTEATYGLGKTTLGASYGEGEDDLSGTETDLTMLFARHHVTDTFTLLGEVQAFASNSGNGDRTAVIVGSQFTF